MTPLTTHGPRVLFLWEKRLKFRYHNDNKKDIIMRTVQKGLVLFCMIINCKSVAVKNDEGSNNEKS